MARIAGVNIPNHQHIVIGLTAIYGIGRPRAQDICAIAGVAPTKKVKDLDDSELEKLRAEIDKFVMSNANMPLTGSLQKNCVPSSMKTWPATPF